MLRGLVVIVIVAGCGRVGFDGRGDGGLDGDAGHDATIGSFQPPWRSGTRIRARLWQATDGEPIFGGWHDTLLDTDCVSYFAADGLERCLPDHVRSDRYFADTTCTATPLAVVPTAACGENRFASQLDGMNHEHVFAIGASYGGTVYDAQSGCIPTLLGTSTAHALGVEEPAASFELTHYHNAFVGNYLHTFSGFEDGAQIDGGSLVLPSGLSCYPRADGLGASACPFELVVTPVYADTGCTDRIYAWDRQSSEPSPPPLAVAIAPSLCHASRTVLQPTADVTVATYYARSPAGCLPQTTAANVRLLRATEIADPFPHGTVVATPRSGRIGHLLWVGDGDGVAYTVANWDQDLEVPCHPFLAKDGVFRCLPATPPAHQATTDPTCAAGVADTFGACYGAVAYDGADYESCEDTPTRVHPLLPVGSPVYAPVEAACPVDPAPAAFRGSGTEVPPAMFPALVESIE